MTRQEYEQKREQEWQTFCNRHGMLDRGHVIIISAFFEAFDHAYALGKQEKNGIDLKKLNEMLDDTLKKETKESLNQWLSEKDADTVTINKGKYDKLCKCSRYMANWVPYFDVCPICGEYNQSGCVCANCNNDKNSTIDVQKAINLKNSKEQFEKATLRLYDVLTTERIIKELENKGIEI